MPLYWPPASSCINVMGAPHGPASTFFAMRGRWPRGSFGAALGLATEINGHLSVFAEGRRLCFKLLLWPFFRDLVDEYGAMEWSLLSSGRTLSPSKNNWPVWVV